MTVTTSKFDPISLAELNAKAEMLTRRDNKYIMRIEALDRLAPQLAEHFDVLDIAGQRNFGYHTCYFDTPMLCSFRHHSQGRRIRSKVRTRHYLDAGICYLEVKLKTRRKVTVKKRQSHDPGQLSQLTDKALAFIDDCHSAQYGRGGLAQYSPVINMRYDRVTLVARSGGERLTIDSGLRFWHGDAANRIADGMVVLETKSRFGRGIADTILRGAGYHPQGSCSKYCLGLAALGRVPRFNKFMPAFNRLVPQGLSTARTARSASTVLASRGAGCPATTMA